MGLVDSWISARTASGEPLSLALAELNEDVGGHYSLSRLGEWRNGRRSVPEIVQRYMLERCLHFVLIRSGWTPPRDESDESYRALADALLPRIRRISAEPERLQAE